MVHCIIRSKYVVRLVLVCDCDYDIYYVKYYIKQTTNNIMFLLLLFVTTFTISFIYDIGKLRVFILSVLLLLLVCHMFSFVFVQFIFILYTYFVPL